MAFAWAVNHPDLHLKLRLFGLYELEEQVRFHYKQLQGIIQDGPQCGLIALAMCSGEASKELVQEIFTHAKQKGYTNNGEIFSVDYMHDLTKQFIKNRTEIYNGALDNEKIINFVLSGGLILVPYDCDKNMQPCLMQGHKAHWAVVSGIIETNEECYVIAKQGKSLNLAIWKLSDLASSNNQLVEFSPDRKQTDVEYILPEGGLEGRNGLSGRCVLVHPNS